MTPKKQKALVALLTQPTKEKAAAAAGEFNDAMNWAEVRLDRIDTLFGWLKKDIENTADNLSAAQTIGELNDAIRAGTDYARTLNEAAAGYMQYARSVGLSAEYADRIRRTHLTDSFSPATVLVSRTIRPSRASASAKYFSRSISPAPSGRWFFFPTPS